MTGGGVVSGTGNHKGCPYDGLAGVYFRSNDGFRGWQRPRSCEWGLCILFRSLPCGGEIQRGGADPDALLRRYLVRPQLVVDEAAVVVPAHEVANVEFNIPHERLFQRDLVYHVMSDFEGVVSPDGQYSLSRS